MNIPLPISGVVITYNEADRIGRCLESLRDVCSELIVVDSGSTDGTQACAGALGAKVIIQPWLGFARQKNLAIEQATNPWVLLLDADEWLGEGANAELRSLLASNTPGKTDVFMLQRRTRFLGAVMNHGSSARELIQRLFRSHCRHELLAVHERLDIRGLRVRATTIRIEHDTARNAEEYWLKLQRYAELWASERAAEGKRVVVGRATVAALAYLIKNLVLRAGLLDGAGAFRYHALHARYVALKYRRLREMRSTKT